MRTLLLLTTLTALAQTGAQTGMDSPSIGFMHDAWGRWHAVQGVAGSFILGPVADAPTPQPAPSNRIEQRGDIFFIVTPEGATVDALPPEARLPILLLGDATLYSTEEGLAIGSARIPCPGVLALRRMSPEWVQVTTSMQGAQHEYVLRIVPGREGLFLLPAAHAPEVRRR